MKKSQLLLLFIAIPFAIYGQHNQGSFLIEGGINFIQSNTETIDGSITEKGPKESAFTFSPSLGYFITKNIAAGVGFSYSSERTEDIQGSFSGNGQTYDYTEELSSSTLAIGPFVRYYLLPFERSGLFLEASFFYGFGDGSDEVSMKNPIPVSPTESVSNFETTQDITFISTGLTPGLIFYITPKMALQASFGFLGYSNVNQEMYDSLMEETTEETISEFEFSFNATSLTLGLSFAF